MGSIMSCFSNLLYLSEKVSLWGACSALIICIVLMYIVTLAFGIGLGYNYCYVDIKTRQRKVPGHFIYSGESRFPYGGGEEEDADDKKSLRTAFNSTPFTEPADTTVSEESNIITTPDNGTYIPGDVPLQHQKQKQNLGINDKDTSIPLAYYQDTTDTSSEFHPFPKALQDPAIPHYDYSAGIGPRGGPSNFVERRRNKDVNKIIIPISGAELKSILREIKSDEKENYTLEITA